VHNVIVPCASHCKLCSYAEPKSFSQAKLAYFDFSSSNFMTQDYILSLLEMLFQG
jgi:hypothetical protein